MSDQLFSDLLVIDCASFVAGPAAATILSDYGARVIKIEPPGTGDGYRMLRYLPSLPVSGSNYPWALTNRNKESLALDLKSAAGRAVLDTLLHKADVFITNYPLPVRARLKLRYEDIQAVNPRTIYASLTPYGEEGPEANNTGYDATAWWARSGLMDSVRASSSTPPALPVPAMGDHMAANTLYGAIATALYRRERTGEGGKVGTSLMGNGLWSNGLYVQAALDGAKMSVSQEEGGGVSAFTQVYCCADQRWFMLTILPQAQDRSWPELARCVEREEWLQDARFSDSETRQQNNKALTQLFRDTFRSEDWAYWNERFARYGITVGRIAQAADQCGDEQATAAGMLSEFDDGSGARTVDSPLYIEGERKRAPHQAPDLGQHSQAILEEFGITGQRLAELKNTGVVGT